MEVVGGQISQVQAEGAGVTFSCRVVLVIGHGESRSLSFTITGRDAKLQHGQFLEAKISHNPAGEEVVFCRNLTTRKVLVDRINFQASRITCWSCAGCLGLTILVFILAPLFVLSIFSWIFHHLF